MPDRRIEEWSEAEVSPQLEADLLEIFERLHALDFTRDPEGKTIPVILTLDIEAKAKWIAFYNEWRVELASLSGDLAALWSKLEGGAARLALLVHCVRQVWRDPTLRDYDYVDGVSIEAGIALARWLGAEGRRIYQILGEDEEERAQREALELIRRKGGSISVRDYQRARCYQRVSDAEEELAALVAEGLGVWQETTPGAAGWPALQAVRADRGAAGQDPPRRIRPAVTGPTCWRCSPR